MRDCGKLAWAADAYGRARNADSLGSRFRRQDSENEVDIRFGVRVAEGLEQHGRLHRALDESSTGFRHTDIVASSEVGNPGGCL